MLVGMAETSGYCSQLVEGLRSIGCRAEHLSLGPDPFGYGPAPRRLAVRAANHLAARRARGPGPRGLWRFLHRVAMAWLLLHALIRYDAFVLRAGDSFFALRDLPIMRRLGKRVVVVFFGSDSRPPYMSGAEVSAGVAGARAASLTMERRRLVERTEQHANEIICHVMSAQLHRRPAIAFLEVGIPRRLSPSVPKGSAQPARSLRALHAPSLVSAKGTAAIQASVREVRARGVDLELVTITGRPNHEVLTAIDECDFVIDELHGDTPMAGFAAEAAARGKPAIVGGYGWEELRRVTRPEALPPAHLCHPDELTDAIVRLATDAAYRIDLGRRARLFVESRWTPEAVARRMLEVVQGTAPESWRFDPAEPVHPYGVSIEMKALRHAVAGVVAVGGASALQVSDKPELESRLLALAGDEDG